MASRDQGGIDIGPLYAAHAATVDFYRNQLRLHDGPRRYLASRGFASLVGTDQPWRIGYAPPGGTALIRQLTRRGYQPGELLAAGLATTSRTGAIIDRFRDRIVFPIRNPRGQVVAFTGRAAPHAASHVPKYLNSPDTAIFHKGQNLYGLPEQTPRLQAGASPVLVEGPFDVHAIHLAQPDGAFVALAPCGTALTAHQADLLRGLAGTEHGVTVAFDPDQAGQAATERAWHLLRRSGTALHAIRLPDGADPASLLTRPNGRAILRTALDGGRPLVEAVIDIHLNHLTHQHPSLLEHIDGRVSATRSIATLLTDLDPAETTRLLGYIAERIGIGVDTAATAIIDALESPTPTSGAGSRSGRQTVAEPGPPGVPDPARGPQAARAFATPAPSTASRPLATRPPAVDAGPPTPRRRR